MNNENIQTLCRLRYEQSQALEEFTGTDCECLAYCKGLLRGLTDALRIAYAETATHDEYKQGKRSDVIRSDIGKIAEFYKIEVNND